MTLSLYLSKNEEKLVKEYAEAHNINVSALLRESVLEKIEDEIDLALYDKAISEHIKEDSSISFDKLVSNINRIV